MDVGNAAATNIDRWQRRADSVCGADEHRADFRGTVAGSAIGTNVGPDKLLHFFGRPVPSIVSTYEVVRATGGHDEAMRSVYESGSWGPSRAAFEQAVGGYRTAAYGTLDLPGCPGDSNYGPYRLSYPSSGTVPPWVLPHNSALVYGSGGQFHENQFCRDVATWESRADVAVTRLAPDVDQEDRTRWPRLLAEQNEDGDLVEVVVCEGERALADVTEIRVSEKYAAAISLDRIYRGLEKRDDEEDNVDDSVTLFASILAESESTGVPVVIVPEET